MARKSRKYPNIDLLIKPSRDTVGCIRLSVRDENFSGSIENQKLIMKNGDANIRSLLCATISTTVSAVNDLTVRHFSK